MFDCVEFNEIKHAIGTQINDDVCCVAYSHHLAVVVTGTAVGAVQVWDFELCRLIAVAQETQFMIKILQFANQTTLV